MEAPDPKKSRAARAAPLLAAVMVVAVVALVIYVVNHAQGGGPPPPRGPFDPLTTDANELRRVTEAVSRVIAAPSAEHEAAVQTLESVRAESAGAGDLKEACVNTYRGLIRAQSLQRELAAVIGVPLATGDGGALAAPSLTPAARTRADELLRRASEQTELVAQSRNRCLDLYAAAVSLMHMEPARPVGR